ncbi:efflux RND transporter periplasmic adaptor subunit [Thiorhodococcus fuscus]|uniref:Efflux RND transporter periplasmic adaptor subunit n=1 Tax=Thiorhodococcus fuscus TaxID=527200 RepID=A0ABW4YDQ5_9GAMM
MLRRLLPVLILCAGFGAFFILKATRPTPQPVEPKEKVWRVQVQTVTPSDHQPLLSLFGQVEAPDRIHATAPVSGQLIEIQVRDGEQVPAGALLARLDPRDLEPRRLRARAQLEKERLRQTHDREALEQERELLQLAEAALERAERVQSKKLGSASSVDAARETLARARLSVTLREQSIAEQPARTAILEAELAEAERDAARSEIRAPFPARIGAVEAAAGDQLKANQAILTLYPLDGLYVRAKVPGAYGPELRQALAAGIRLEAHGTQAGRPVTAVLERISGEADARGVDALLRLAPETQLPLGAFVQLRLQRPIAPDTIAIPFSALHGGDRLFLVEDGRLHAIQVERIGELDGGDGAQQAVRAPGLADDSKVMITHLPNAVESLKVETIQ